MAWMYYRHKGFMKMSGFDHMIIFLLSYLLNQVCCEQTFRVEPEDATGIRGQTIWLRCEIDGLIGRVTWTRNDFGLGIGRDLPSYPRYRLEGSEKLGEYTLMISNLQLEDDAEFQCQIIATPHSPAMATRKARVTVYLPPDEPKIIGEDPIEVVAGEPVNLTCYAANGKPAPTLTWLTGSLPVTDQTYYIAEDQSDGKRQNATSSLTIIPKKSDQGQRYYCEAKNEGTAGRSLRTSVGLEVLYAPEVSMLVLPRHQRVKEGTSVKFTCEAISNPSEVTWKWFRETEELAGQTTNVLTQKVDRDWHGAKVQCEATNKVGSTRQTVILNVEYAPRFTAGAEHMAADVGDDAVLTCSVDGNPEPSIIWTRKDSMKILGSHKQLKLFGVREKDFGIYVCKASILGFNEIQMEIHLLKKGPPKILSPSEQSSRFGETGVVECLSLSVPKPNTILWHKDGEPINFDELERYQNREEDLPDGKRSIVEITSVQDADYGVYNCSVENGYGNDTITITFTQKEIVPLEYVVAGVLVGVFLIILVAVVLVVYRRRKSSSSDSGSEISGDSIDKKDDGMPYKVEYNPSGYGNLYNVDAWKSDADKNLYRQSAEYDELNYVPKDPWAPDPYDPRDIYGSHYGGIGPGYARSDYGTYPGPARNHIYEPGRYGSQSVYGGPTFSDYGIYGTYGHRPPPPRTDFIPASELGRPSTAMSSRLSTNV